MEEMSKNLDYLRTAKIPLELPSRINLFECMQSWKSSLKLMTPWNMKMNSQINTEI